MPVDPKRVETLFNRAIGLPPDDRSAFLAAGCGDDPDLRARVDRLLAAHDELGGPPPGPSNSTGAFTPDAPASAPPTASFATDASTADYTGRDEHAGAIIAGKYTLVEVIGEGGMGSVWRAKQTEPVKRFVAVKLIKAGMDSRQVLARFEAERQALALMDHPNISKVLDGGLHEQRPFFVMELVKGVPITEHCDSRKLTPKERLELFVPVCQAIQHAHQKGIIHRDIKPSNVLIALYDDKPVVKVIDFGVAKATGGTLTEQTIDTGYGGVVGTPQYMSPEQATLNNLDIDTRSDVYALGVLLYELLVGTPPFSKKELEKKGLLEMLRVVREQEPPRPSTKLTAADALPTLAANRGIEPKRLTGLLRNELDWIVMKALEKDRSRRYETANGFAADVLRYLGGEAVQAHPPSTSYRLKKFVRRNRGQVIAASMVVLALLVGMVGTTLGLFEARRQAQIAREETAAKELARSAEVERVTERDDALRNEAQRVTERDAALDDANYQLDNSRFLLAVAAYDNRDVALARYRLASIQGKHRGWEWHYLRRQATGGIFTLYGHTDSVSSVAFSSDDTRIVTGSHDGTAKVWDARTGRQQLELKCHRGRVSSVAFSPDGTRIVTGSADSSLWVLNGRGEAKVWDARTGTSLLELKGHTGDVLNVAFSPDGTRIVTGSKDQTAKVWDARTGTSLLELKGHTRAVRSVAFSPDGTRIATGGGEYDQPGEAKVWDARTGTSLLELKGHTGDVFSVAFSPDGMRIVTGSLDETAKVWDARTGTPQLELKGHTSGVSGAAFSPDGTRIVTGSGKMAEVWDAGTGTLQLELKGHTSGVSGVAFSPDGTRITTGSLDQTAKVWDAKTGMPQLELRGHSIPVSSVAFSLDGERIVTGGGEDNKPGEAKVWDARTGTPLLELKGHTSAVSSVAFSPDGTRIATGGRLFSVLGEVKVWDARTGTPQLELEVHTNAERQLGFSVFSVAFSPDGTRIVTGSSGGAKKVWDAKTGTLQLDLSGDTGTLWCVAFSPDGKRIVTGSGDEMAKVWDAKTGTSLLELKGHTCSVSSVAFSPDGTHIVTGSWDHTVRVWDAQSGIPQLELKGHTSLVSSVAFSPDGTRIITGGGEYGKPGETKVWDARTGTPLLELKAPKGCMFTVAFSPDGTRIVSGIDDKSAKVWDTRTGTPHLELEGHLGDVSSVAFSPDGTRIVTGSWDHTAKVWDARTGTPQLELKGHTRAVRSVAFSPDGTRILTSAGLPGQESEVKVWDAHTGTPQLDLSEDTGPLWCVAFSLDGTRIVTEDDGGIKLLPKVWDAKTGQELVGEPIPQTIANTRTSPDGRFFAYPEGNRVELIPLHPDGEELAYRLLHTQPNLGRYREGYESAQAAKDDFAARFWLDRLIELSIATNKPDEAKKWRAERAKYTNVAPPPRKKK